MRRYAWSLLLWTFCLGFVLPAAGAQHHGKPKAKSHKASEPAKKAAEDKAKAVEPVEEVEPVEATPAETSHQDDQGPPGIVEIISRLHPAVVHLPIAWVMLLWLTDVGALVFNRREVMTAGLYLSVLALLSFAPAVVTGLLRLQHLPQDPTALHPALVHRNVMYGCALLCAAIVGIRVQQRNELEGATRWIYLALVTLALAGVSIGGHLGGRLVYGDDFLPF